MKRFPSSRSRREDILSVDCFLLWNSSYFKSWGEKAFKSSGSMGKTTNPFLKISYICQRTFINITAGPRVPVGMRWRPWNNFHTTLSLRRFKMGQLSNTNQNRIPGIFRLSIQKQSGQRKINELNE